MRHDETANNDHAWIARAKEGDMEAFEQLIRKYQKPIYYLCYRMTGAHQSADDLSQDTFIKAFFSLQRFQDGMSFYAWIRKIAVNSSLNYLKERKREEPLGVNEDRVTGNHNSPDPELPHEKLQRNRLEVKFREALEALPDNQRMVFILRVYENQSYQEIADSLDIPIGTVMSRLSRSRKKLKDMMAEYL